MTVERCEEINQFWVKIEKRDHREIRVGACKHVTHNVGACDACFRGEEIEIDIWTLVRGLTLTTAVQFQLKFKISP